MGARLRDTRCSDRPRSEGEDSENEHVHDGQDPAREEGWQPGGSALQQAFGAEREQPAEGVRPLPIRRGTPSLNGGSRRRAD